MTRISALVLAACAVLGAPGAAQANCTLDSVANEYARALAKHREGDFKGARSILGPLANQGIGPAQSKLASMLWKGEGVADKAKAAFWAALSDRQGDLFGASVLTKMKKDPSNAAAIDKANKDAKGWKPETPNCLKIEGLEVKPLNDQAVRVGRFAVVLNPGLPKNEAEAGKTGMKRVLRKALDSDPLARAYLPLIQGFEVIPSNRYDRYIGWRTQQGHVLWLSSGNFQDKDASIAAKTVVMEARRRVYDRMEGALLRDPLVRRMAGKKVYGSPYPDVKNEPFFKSVQRSLRMTKKLPEKLRRNIDIITEIRYNPPSKHYKRSGTLDVSAAYYHKGISKGDRRIVFLRRDMLWSSDADLFLSLLHEGVHAVQDERAEGYLAGLHEREAQRVKLINAGEKDKAAKLRAEIDKERDYANRWLKGKKTTRGIVPDISFECEAISAEIRGARAINAPPSSVEDSQYLKVCDNARVLLVRWKDSLILGGRKR